MKFEDLNLSPELLSGIKSAKFEKCTPVQETVITPALEGKDISGLAQTGTGKTAAFLVPMMERIWSSKVQNKTEDNKKREFKDWKKGDFVLILVPTRELAEQVFSDVYKLRGDTGIEAVAIYGGASYEGQKEKINAGVEIIIGTPGRLIDLYKSHSLDLKKVRGMVFDEADRMFDMGFKDDMQYVLYRAPKDRQILLFSATLNFDVVTTAYKFGADPIEFNLSKDEVKAENVEDEIFHIGTAEKPKYLLSILKKLDPKQVIIFSNFKSNVSLIAHFLNKNGYHAVGISSLLTQGQRNRVMEQFKGDSKHNVMVATDLAARGLDVKGVDLVVNYELPDDPENYIHRIGRTGRAGKKGRANSFVGDRDVEALMRIEEYLKMKLPVGWMEDTELLEEFVQFPRESDTRPRRSNSNSGQSGGRSPRGRKSRSQGGGRSQQRNSRTRNEDDRKRSSSAQNRSDRSSRGSEKSESRSTSERNHSDRSKRRDGRTSNESSNRQSGETVHRDRKTGRHGNRANANNSNNKSHNSQTKSARPQKPKRKNTRRRSSNRRSRQVTQQPKSMGQKIKGFFKKIFE